MCWARLYRSKKGDGQRVIDVIKAYKKTIKVQAARW